MSVLRGGNWSWVLRSWKRGAPVQVKHLVKTEVFTEHHFRKKKTWVRNWQFLPPHVAWIRQGPMPNRLIGPSPWASPVPYPIPYCTYCAHVVGAAPQALYGMDGGNPYAQVTQALQNTCIADHWFTLENESMSTPCFVAKHSFLHFVSTHGVHNQCIGAKRGFQRKWINCLQSEHMSFITI